MINSILLQIFPRSNIGFVILTRIERLLVLTDLSTIELLGLCSQTTIDVFLLKELVSFHEEISKCFITFSLQGFILLSIAIDHVLQASCVSRFLNLRDLVRTTVVSLTLQCFVFSHQC